MPFFKTIAPLDQGVNQIADELIIPENAWTSIDRMRIRRKRLQSFPGWKSIFASGTKIGAFGTLAEEFLLFDGTSFFLIGDGTTIYRYNPATKTLTSLGTTFTPTRDEPWMSFFYKNNMYVTNKNDGLFTWDGSAGSFTAVGGSPPKARSGNVLNDHVMLLNDTVDPQRLSWSAEGSVSTWGALATNDAGSLSLNDTPDVGVALHRFADDIIAYKERTIVPVTFVGGSAVFARRTAISGIGLLGQYAIQDLGDSHAFMGPDTFYLFSGTQDIDDQWGRPIWDLVYPRLHPNYKNRSRSIFIEEFRELIFMFPSTASVNDPDTWVVHNIDDGTWYGPFPIAATFAGFTSKAATLFIDDVTDVINTVSDLIDSFAGIIGAPINIFVDSSGLVHHLGGARDANGVAITRTAESGDHFVGVGGRLDNGHEVVYPPESVFMVTAINLFLRANGVSGSTGQLYIGHRMELGDDISWQGPYTFKLDNAGVARVPVRASGRWFRVRFSIPSSWEMILTSYQYEIEYQGRR